MSKQVTRKHLSIALSAAIASTLGAAGVANATATGSNPFAMEELMSGYLTAGGHDQGKNDDKENNGKNDDKENNGKNDDKENNGKNDDKGNKGGEGKCGEGKCGGSGS